jgi:hypothetical protein
MIEKGRFMGNTKTFYSLGVLACWLFFVSGALAQTDELPVPAPAKTIAAEDRSALEAVTKPKDRTKKAIELAESRLQRAEQLHEKQEFPAALEQLGRYQGIIAHTLAFLKPFRAERLREPFRNIEVALRKHIPRLEALRRQTPVAYAVHIRAIGLYARDARAEALNAFFDDTVIPGEDPAPENKKNDRP